MTTPTFLWRIGICVPDGVRETFEDYLETISAAVSSFENEDGAGWTVEGFADAEPDERAIAQGLAATARKADVEPPKPKIDLVPPRDWLAENLAQFPPLRIGRYFLHGSHFDGNVPAGALAIELDAGTAFGSGEHATTEICLRFLDHLARRRRFSRILDMGCGSGVLSVAAAKTWPQARVTASDIDDEAARVTALNALGNGVGKRVKALCGVGYASPVVRTRAPYDLILANILTRPLVAMAGDLKRHLRPGGIAVLSGFLERDSRRVVWAHEVHGLRQIQGAALKGWRTVLLSR